MTGPVQILDRQQTRLLSSSLLHQPRESAPLAETARCVIHGVVEAPELGRLRQIQQIIEEDGVVGLDQMLLQRFCRCRLRTRKIAAILDTQQRAQERGDGIASARRAEVEDEAGMTGEAGTAGSSPELFHQACLADTGLAAEVDGPAPSGLPAGLEQRQEALPLDLPADQGDPVRSRG